MSNSIWKKPTVRPVKDCIVVWQNPARMSFTLPRTARKYIEMYNCERWSTLDDLIAQADKAERLQKGIDLLFRQATVWSWQTAPTPDKKIVLSRRQILGWLRKLKEIVEG